jgi:UPF0271 protein
MAILLNCDLGESYGDRRVGMDAQVMPHIHQANIACGFHGGDPLTMRATLVLAADHGVTAGAHPSYPDLEGFGRRSMRMAPQELVAALHYQVAALEGMARNLGVRLAHIKPHGALYNDMMREADIRAAVIEAVASYHQPLVLVMQATQHTELHREEAESAGVSLQFEAFADRCYDDDGALLSRDRPGAVHSRERMLDQVRQLLAERTVTTVSGRTLTLHAQTLCVHGDNPEAVGAVRAIRELVDAG